MVKKENSELQKTNLFDKKVGWDEITSSCAIKDTLFLGFGNGALVKLNSLEPIQQKGDLNAWNGNVTVVNLSFSGPENKPVNKLAVYQMD